MQPIISLIFHQSNVFLFQARQLMPVVYSREGTDFQYHDQILAGTSKLCRHLKEAASMQVAALFLAPEAFSNPYGQMAGEQVPLRTQSFMAFLTDPTRLIANPGLRPGVRPDTATTSTLVSHWRKQAATIIIMILTTIITTGEFRQPPRRSTTTSFVDEWEQHTVSCSATRGRGLIWQTWISREKRGTRVPPPSQGLSLFLPPTSMQGEPAMW